MLPSTDQENEAAREKEISQAILRVVSGLKNRPGFALLSTDDFVLKVRERLSRVFKGDNSGQDIPPDASIEKSAKAVYSAAVYNGWRSKDRNLTNQSCEELGYYLYRIAYNRMLRATSAANLAASLAEDSTQQTLLQIHQSIHLVRDPERFLGYAIQIINHVCSDTLRTARKHEEMKEKQEGEDQPDPMELAVSEDMTARTELLDCLLKAISSLPNKESQSVILLGYFSGLPDAQIAEILKTSVGNVQVLRHRALARLRNDENLRDFLNL
jgi:RNA polymerase sigma factor (sigma-70 family)